MAVEYRRGNLITRITRSGALPVVPIMLLPFDRRRVVITITHIPNAGGGKIETYIGYRNNWMRQLSPQAVAFDWPHWTFRKNEIGGIVCGEVWGSTVAFSALMLVCELLDVRL